MPDVDYLVPSQHARADIPRALVNGFDASISAATSDMTTNGSACLRDVVSAEWLAAARDFVHSSVHMDGKQELLIENFGTDRDNFARELVTDPRVAAYLRTVATTCFPRLQVDGQLIETELRLVNGPPRHDDPLWFHYDGTVVTMVIPIIIPTGTPGHSGELILAPNRRPFRRSVITNIVEKSLSQNNVYRRHFVKGLKRHQTTTAVALEPGNAYLFCGYRSYHATLPCPPDSLRVTLIMHFGAVHHGSRLLETVRSVRQKLLRSRRSGSSIATVTLNAD